MAIIDNLYKKFVDDLPLLIRQANPNCASASVTTSHTAFVLDIISAAIGIAY